MKQFALTVNITLAAALALCAAPASAQMMAMSFASPSGNIVCYTEGWDYETDSMRPYEEQPVTCLIFDAAWDLPDDYGDDDPTCDLDRTRTVTLPPEGAPYVRWSCHGDIFWPIPNPKISYGAEWSILNHTCSVGTDGVRCTNATDNGFFVRKAAIDLN